MRVISLRAALAVVVAAALLQPTPAISQSSANYKLLPGQVESGKAATSPGYLMTFEIGQAGRVSGASTDLVPGFVGGAYATTATVSYSTAAGVYKSLAFPVNASNNSVLSVLDELGGADNTAWRFFHWSPVDSSYLEAPGALTTVAPGLGYWLITAGAANVTDVGLPAPTRQFEVALTAGPAGRPAWNQMGNPFLFPVAVSGLLVTDGVTQKLLTDPTNTWTEQVVKEWNGSAYVNAVNLNGRTGYWARKIAAGTVKVLFPYKASTGGSPEPALAKPDGALWAVGLRARQGDRSAEPLLVGAAAVTRGEWNPLCLSRAPAPPGDFLSLSLPKSDWGRMSGEYVREFQPPAETMSWEFVAAGAEAPGELALDVLGFELPSGTRLWLTDLRDGVTREIFAGQTVAVAATAEPRGFRMAATIQGAPAPRATPLVDALRYSYPNPFTARVGMTFGVATTGDVSVGIFDVMGRQVQRLERRDATAGEHVLLWDGRDSEGTTLPAGVYLARYRVGSKEGTTRLVKVQ